MPGSDEKRELTNEMATLSPQKKLKDAMFSIEEETASLKPLESNSSKTRTFSEVSIHTQKDE